MTEPPDFFIAGAMRGGTTALAVALDRHPDVRISTPKEPNYFAIPFGAARFRGPGDQWFAAQNATSWDDYQQCFAGADGRLSGDASAMYLALPETAEAIASVVPAAKIILVLRDPMARAVSAHGYLWSTGREQCRRFADALTLEAVRRTEGYGPIWWYEGASDYRLGLEAYSRTFGPDRLLVVTTERMNSDAAGTLRTICDFLGLPYTPILEAALAERVNESGLPRSRILAKLLYPPDRVRHALRTMAPPAVVGRIRNLRRVRPTRSGGSQVLVEHFPPATRAAFRDVAERVETFVGESLSGVWPSRDLAI